VAEKLFFVSVLCVFNKFINHDGSWGNTAQALTQWQHPGASNEALDVLHWAMCLASHHRIRTVIKVTSNLPAFFVVADYLFKHNLSQRPCYGQHKLKPSYCVFVIDVMSLFVLYGCPPLTMDAVLATIF
jgi:hypothetical protein